MQGFKAQMPFVGHTERALLRSWRRENNPPHALTQTHTLTKGQVIAIVEVPAEYTKSAKGVLS